MSVRLHGFLPHQALPGAIKSGVRRVVHAAALLSSMSSIPSLNWTPSMTLASWWKPRSRRQDLQTAAQNQTTVAAGWSRRGGAKLCQSVSPFRSWGGWEDSHRGAVSQGASGVPGRDERARGGAPFRGLTREREEDARVLRPAGVPTHSAGAPSEARRSCEAEELPDSSTSGCGGIARRTIASSGTPRSASSSVFATSTASPAGTRS